MINNSIKVSVIMPVYNARDFLRQALDGVLAQTLKEFELICVDDGSTDGSLDIIKEYQKGDARIRIITENNAGPSTARNKGIVRARGEYMIFLDADDFYEPELLEKLYNYAKKENLDIAFTKFDVYNNKTEKYSPCQEEPHGDVFVGGAVISKNEYPHYILECTSGYVWNKMFNTEFVRSKGLTFDPEIYVFEDVHFICTALSLAERVGRIEDVLIHHRVYSEQSRAKLFRKYYNQVPTVYIKIKEFLMHHGMYIPLMRSYLNLSAGRCYKIYNLLWNEAKTDFWNMLHFGGADSMNWYRHGPAEFDNHDVCDFVVNVELYTYEQYSRRVEQGLEIDVDELSLDDVQKRIQTTRKSARFKEWFVNLFCKKTKAQTPENQEK